MADIQPQNILVGLPGLQWRGLDAPPYDTIPVDVSHSQAERRFPYIDGAGHDHTGRDPLQLQARLMFVNTLAIRSSVRLFPDLWEDWREALLDGSSGDLRHPVFGPLRARVMSFNVETNANQTIAGVVVNVNWVETVDDPAEASEFQPLQNNITSLAADADSALEATEIEFPDGTGEPLASLLQQLEGFVTLSASTAAGVINQGLGQVEQLVDTIDATNDAANFAVRDVLIQLYGALQDANERLGQERSRSTAVRAFPFAITLDSAATELGNSLQDLMTLNTSLLRTPSVPPGTGIRYYVD